MSKPSFRVAVVMQRRAVQNRWIDCVWEPWGVLASDERGEPRQLLDEAGVAQWLHPGFTLQLHRDEAEGYYLNVSSEVPSVFVSLRIDEESGEPYPFQATLSYNEAARWMDSNERVERVAASPEIAGWATDWVAANYRPEPKKRQRPKSFRGKEGRLREEGSQ